MNQLTHHDEFLHLGYPDNLEHEWKENYYFNFVDADAQACGIIHFSIRRKAKRATFNVKGSFKGKRLSYSNMIEWPPQESGETNSTLSERRVVSDGKLSLDIVEPHSRHRVTLRSENLELNLDYRSRFTAYQYPQDSADLQDKGMAIEHYEQGMTVEGLLVVDGEQVAINCLAHRDHSWGFRNETAIDGWNWIAVQFPNSTLNFTQIRRHQLPNIEQGFISTASGNRRIIDVDVISVEQDEEGRPAKAVYKVSRDDDEVMTFEAVMFDRVVLPVNRDGTTVYFENFSHFTHVESGEKGVGIDEHMVNF